MMTGFGRLHVWGFRVVPGEYVGGGLYDRVLLSEGELIDDALMCMRTDTWIPTSGYLVITNRRLIYIPLRWPLSLLNSKPTSVEYSAIGICRAEMRREPRTPTSFFAKALVIGNNRGAEWEFRPVAPIEALVRRVEELRAES